MIHLLVLLLLATNLETWHAANAQIRGSEHDGRGPAKHNVIGDLISEGPGKLELCRLHRTRSLIADTCQ